MRGMTPDDKYYFVMFTEEEVADLVPDNFDKDDIPTLCDELTRYWENNMQEHINDVIDWCW